jgi:hypothetical protein
LRIKDQEIRLKLHEHDDDDDDDDDDEYLSTSLNFLENIQVRFRSANNNGYFTRRPMYIYDNIFLNST